MTTFPITPDYTDKDFRSLNRRVDHLIAAVFPTWTETARANFGNVFKEGFCFIGDVLTFYQDQQARETRWGTATQRYALIALARLIGYTLEGARAATATVRFTLSQVAADDVVLLAGTRLKTASLVTPVYFQLLSDLTILQGNLYEDGVVENSESFVDNYVAKGEKDEEFVLLQTPFLDDSDSMLVGIDTWTRVDSFFDSTSTDKHYIVLVDQNDKATIRVGDGTNGAIPTPGSAVSISYKTGGGLVGNVEASSIVKLEGGPFYDQLGNPVTISVNNSAAASGGQDRETVAQARDRAPLSLRVLNRTIARTDWEDRAVQNASVARALMLTNQEDATVPEGRGYLYIVPVGGGSPSLALRTEIEDEINTDYPGPLNFSWEVRATTVYKVVDVKVWLYPSQNAVEANIATSIRSILSAYFAPLLTNQTKNTEIDWGFYYEDEDGNPDPRIAYSKVYKKILETEGVRRFGTPNDSETLLLYGRGEGDPADPDSGVADDIEFLAREFPKAGEIKIINADDLSTIYDGPID